MSHVEKLDLMGVSSLAAVAAVLLVGWIATTSATVPRQAGPVASEAAVTLDGNGTLKVTVTAPRATQATPAPRPVRSASASLASGVPL